MNHQRIRLLPALRPRRTLRLLCLLVPSRTGEAHSVPVLVLRAQAPRMDIQGHWAARLPVGLMLREVQAWAPRAEVLARCIWLRRAVRPGALSHV
jgi:hypothetical protein